ncbi:MAG: RecX family transcriptional regulator [Deltaproteobacteria bacterium]|nr:RecX family transcriptional regulator [Deltaproteobacteria bacterium]
MNYNNDFKNAKNIALKFLAYSPKSQKALEDKLKNKGFDKDIIDKVLDNLKEFGFVDDKVFAVQWARANIKNKLWGRNRVKSGLIEKGISKEIIEGAIKEIEQEISSEEVIKKAFEKWLKRQGQGARVRDKEKIKARAFRHLITKGFQPFLINQTLNKYYKDSEEFIDE